MAAKMLDEVLSKEKQVAENEQSANENAEKIIADAKEKAKEIEKQAQKEIQDYEGQQIKLANARHEKAVEDAQKDAEVFVEVLKGKADTKFSEAVGIVRDIIVD